MNDKAKAKAILNKMEATISKIAGLKIELTIRTESDWTISVIGNHRLDKVKGFFIDRLTHWEIDYDEELDETFVYLTVK